jgi:CTP-dependent riboflavin kinase
MPVPPDYVQKAAQRALDVRETLAPSNRAGTSVGLARARDLARGANVSQDTINRMISYLSRTEKVYKEAKAKGRTIQDSKQILATYLWGGPRALAWAKSKKDD